MRLSFFLLLGFAWLGTGCSSLFGHGAQPDANVLSLDGALGNTFLEADAPNEVVARLVVTAPATQLQERRPVNVALVVDTSGSMEGKAIADARAASLAMVGALADGDYLSLVVFNSRTEVVLPSSELGSGTRKAAKRAIDGIRAEGTTDMEGGLRAGLAELQKHFDVRGVNRMVLLGDGVPNIDASVRGIARSAGDRGISITALGLGADHDETLMGAIAQLSRGKFHYVETSDHVAAFFRDEVLRLDTVVARGATLELAHGPGVRITGVSAQVVAPTARGVRIGLGDFSRGERREIIVRLKVDARHDGSIAELFDAELAFRDLAEPDAQPIRKQRYFGAHATADRAKLAAGRNRAVEDAAALVAASLTTMRAIADARRGNVKSAESGFDFASDALEAQGQSSGNAALEARAKEIRALKKAIPAPSPAGSPPQQMPKPMLKAYDYSFQSAE